MAENLRKEWELKEQEQQLTLTPESVVGSFSSDSLYKRVLQGAAIHGLIAAPTSEKAFQMNAITHTGTAKSEGFELTLDENIIGLYSPQTEKGIALLLMKATEQLPHGDQITPENIQKNLEIEITLDDYMRACNIRDRKTARKQLNTIVQTIYGISIKWRETEWSKPEGKSRKVKERMEYDTRIIDGMGVSVGDNPVKGGRVKVSLTLKMAYYLATRYPMPIPSALFTINTNNNPYSFPLGWKLCALDNINITNNHPERVGHTTVKTLLNAVKGIPRYESIAHRGNIYDKIIEPFDRDMRELVKRGILSGYYYYDDMGARVDNIGAISYLTFSGLNIWYELKDYPSQILRLEAKQKRISAARKKAIRAAKKKQEAEAQAAEEDYSLDDLMIDEGEALY